MSESRAPGRAWAGLLVAITAAVLYAPSLLNGFAYDDEAIVTGDVRVRSFAHLGEILTGGYWADSRLGLYRPLTTLSFALDWSIGFGDPAWFHLTNVLLHAGASVLVFLLLTRWFDTIAALAGGLLFAIHPVHVEAVANVVGRSELLAAIGVFATCLLWLYRPADPRHASVRSAGIIVAFAFGMLAKESAIVALPLVLLLDVAERRLDLRRPQGWLTGNAAAFGGMLAVCVLWFVARWLVLGTLTPTRVDAAFDVASGTAARIWTALQAWPVWATLLFTPTTLLADYGPRVLLPVTGPTATNIPGAVILLGLLAAGTTAAATGRGRALVALLWFPITILPVSNLIVPTGVIVAERTLYLPSLVVSLVAAALVAVASGSLASARVAPTPRFRRAVLVGLAAYGLLLGVRTLTRIPAWRSTDAVFEALGRDRPDSFRAQWYFAREARQREDTSEAVRLYQHAIEIWPYRQKMVVEAAAYAAETGHVPHANALARHALRLDPKDVDALRLLAGTSLDLGDTATARLAIENGLAVAPTDDVLQRMRAAVAHHAPDRP